MDANSRGYVHPCKQCGNTFRCRPSDVLNGRSYCSDECRWELQRTKFAHAIAVKIVQKLVRKLQRTYIRTKKKLAADRKRQENLLRQRECLRCGKRFHAPIVRGVGNRLCSDECRRESRRINKRTKGKRTSRPDHIRCKEKGLPFDVAITRQFVHDRDGYRCMLCGRQTVKGDRFAAPHLGHIVPLKNPLNVRHGHVANNTFTNCAACNNRQGNAVVIDGHQNHDDPREAYIQHIAVWGYPFVQHQGPTESPTRPPREFVSGFRKNVRRQNG